MLGAVRYALLVVFALLVLQGATSLAARLAAGGEDALHPALHLASGLVGLFAGWRGGLGRYALGFGAGYALLGVAGLLGFSPAWLPLGPVDHAFHLTLGSVLAALGAWSSKARAPAASA
ncbi:MAG TPA: hypothetical protein VFH78_15510 [Candidatus Thermoplasmatota archaeon]|nr:hypothetical protein [Candidatus Thermoplasmatota archaeon]